MSDPHLESIKDLLDNDDVPPRVTNRAIFRGLQAIWVKMGVTTDCLSEISEWRGDMEKRVNVLEENRRVNPSLFAYIKSNPRAAAVWLVGILAFMTLALAFSEPLRAWVSLLIP